LFCLNIDTAKIRGRRKKRGVESIARLHRRREEKEKKGKQEEKVRLRLYQHPSCVGGRGGKGIENAEGFTRKGRKGRRAGGGGEKVIRNYPSGSGQPQKREKKEEGSRGVAPKEGK